MHFPPPFDLAEMLAVRASRKERDCVAAQKASMTERIDEDMAGPKLAKIGRPYKGTLRLYEALVRAFAGAGSHDQALVLKVSIKARMPGNRRLVEQAFQEALETS